jgi:hypothetical protein
MLDNYILGKLGWLALSSSSRPRWGPSDVLLKRLSLDAFVADKGTGAEKYLVSHSLFSTSTQSEYART